MKYSSMVHYGDVWDGEDMPLHIPQLYTIIFNGAEKGSTVFTSMSWWFCRRQAHSTSSGCSDVPVGHLTNTWTGPPHSSHLTRTELWWTHLNKKAKNIKRHSCFLHTTVSLFFFLIINVFAQQQGEQRTQMKKNALPKLRAAQLNIVLDRSLLWRMTVKTKSDRPGRLSKQGYAHKLGGKK